MILCRSTGFIKVSARKQNRHRLWTVSPKALFTTYNNEFMRCFVTGSFDVATRQMSQENLARYLFPMWMYTKVITNTKRTIMLLYYSSYYNSQRGKRKLHYAHIYTIHSFPVVVEIDVDIMRPCVQMSCFIWCLNMFTNSIWIFWKASQLCHTFPEWTIFPSRPCFSKLNRCNLCCAIALK